MVFVTEKIKQTNKFSLGEIGHKKAARRSPGLRAWQKFGIALVSGSLLALSGPGFDQWWLAWIMVAPFLVVLSFCDKSREALFSGLFFGLGYHLVSLHYYLALAFAYNEHSSLSWQICVVIWTMQALALSVPTMIFAWLICSLPLRPGYIPYFTRPFFSYLLSVPLIWVFLHCGLTVAGPLTKIWQLMMIQPVFIDPLAYSQYQLLEMLQFVKYVGAGGIEFILVLVNTALAAFFVEIIEKREKPVERIDLISPRLGALIDVLVSVLIVVIIYGFGRSQVCNQIQELDNLNLCSDPKTDSGQPIIPVALLIGDLSSIDNNFPALGKQLPIVVLPEASKEISFDQAGTFLSAMKDAARANKNLLFVNFVSKAENELTRHSLIFAPSDSLSIKQEIYSPTVLLSLEKISKSNNFSFLSTSIKEWLFSLDRNGKSSWDSLEVPRISWGRVGLLSGSDITDSRLVAREVRRGASLLISSTNLSWTRSKFLNKQLLAAAIFRAIENNRYVILSTNSGLLTVIEPTGIVQDLSFAQLTAEQLQSSAKSLVLGSVQFRWSKTPFTKMWWL